MRYEIHYGKADVRVYRTHATPLAGISPDPQSPFAGRANTLMAAELEVVVRGEAFLDAYTLGVQPAGGGDRHDEELHPRRQPGLDGRRRWRDGCITWAAASWASTRTWSN